MKLVGDARLARASVMPAKNAGRARASKPQNKVASPQQSAGHSMPAASKRRWQPSCSARKSGSRWPAELRGSGSFWPPRMHTVVRQRSGWKARGLGRGFAASAAALAPRWRLRIARPFGGRPLPPRKSLPLGRCAVPAAASRAKATVWAVGIAASQIAGRGCARKNLSCLARKNGRKKKEGKRSTR